MYKQLKKAINLVKKTGDRLVIYDMRDDDNAYAVMNLAEYEKMILERSKIHGLTEDELIDKINRDIAIWKSVQDPTGERQNHKSVKTEKIDKINDYYSYGIDDYTGKFDENYHFNEENAGKKEKNPWKIPSNIKENAEEVIEEDRQYLEEIKY